MKIFSQFFLIFVLFSCKTYNDQDKKAFDSKIQKFLSSSKSKYLKSESGLYYCVEKKGDGRSILITDEVSFTYVGKLLNGKVFDLNHKKRPVTFKVKALIQAWQEAMLYLNEGGKIKLVVPPQLGYGDYELDEIPKNSILFFELEVLKIK